MGVTSYGLNNNLSQIHMNVCFVNNMLNGMSFATFIYVMTVKTTVVV